MGPTTVLSMPESSTNTHFLTSATGWTVMAKTVRDIDEGKVKDCKEDIDTLLVFVSLGIIIARELTDLTCTGRLIFSSVDRVCRRVVSNSPARPGRHYDQLIGEDSQSNAEL